MRAAKLAGILVLDIGRPLECIGRAPHPALRGRGLSFRDRHDALLDSFAENLDRKSGPYRGTTTRMPERSPDWEVAKGNRKSGTAPDLRLRFQRNLQSGLRARRDTAGGGFPGTRLEDASKPAYL